VEDVQEDSDPEPESDADPYGSLDGGSPKKILGDEGNKKGDGEDNDPKDNHPEPRSPNIDIKSAKRDRISHIVIYQLRVTTSSLCGCVCSIQQDAGCQVADCPISPKW
jgi:hypothetical protein